MKLIFAGLILFLSTGAAAQTTNAVNRSSQKKLTPEKMREVILADERQHEAKAPIMLKNNFDYNVYKMPTAGGYKVVRTNYVKQHRNALLEGLGTALSFAKGFTRFADATNVNYSDQLKYSRVPY